MREDRQVRQDGQIIRRLYRSSVVSIIIAAVAAMFGMLIDGVIIGKFLGTDCVAAYGLVTPLFSIMTAISGVLAAGSQGTARIFWEAGSRNVPGRSFPPAWSSR